MCSSEKLQDYSDKRLKLANFSTAPFSSTPGQLIGVFLTLMPSRRSSNSRRSGGTNIALGAGGAVGAPSISTGRRRACAARLGYYLLDILLNFEIK